jgi:LacI family transcriptional regulator
MAKRKQLRQRDLPRVALLIETTRAYGRDVMRGVGDYSRIYGPWLFYIPVEMPVNSVPPPDEWDGEGIIVQPRQNKEFLKQLADRGIPVVNLSGPPGAGGFPAVRANQEAVADLAMAHFRDRGFVRYCYCAGPGVGDWPPTGDIFKALATRSGFACEIYKPPEDVGTPHFRLAHLAEWLKQQVKPIGVLAANDLRAREVLDACRLADLHVPEEVAVLGINDDELICEMANPPLSSVSHNTRRVGYEAAAMLHRLMMGKKVMADIVIDPIGVKARQSTDLLAIEDPEVATAVRFIRENACNGIRVDDVLDQVALSRRGLEKRFRKAVGRPPHMEIRRVQLERVKELLISTNYKLEYIAEITGFSTAQYLAGLFHRVVKMTPGAWRQSGRAGMRPAP